MPHMNDFLHSIYHVVRHHQHDHMHTFQYSPTPLADVSHGLRPFRRFGSLLDPVFSSALCAVSIAAFMRNHSARGDYHPIILALLSIQLRVEVIIRRTSIQRGIQVALSVEGPTKVAMQAGKSKQTERRVQASRGSPAEGKGPVQQSVKSKQKCQPHMRKRKSQEKKEERNREANRGRKNEKAGKKEGEKGKEEK
eukprot:6213576-Pleurochrysis_carterae.AAC.2